MGIRANRYKVMVPTVTGALRLRGRAHAQEARVAITSMNSATAEYGIAVWCLTCLSLRLFGKSMESLRHDAGLTPSGL